MSRLSAVDLNILRGANLRGGSTFGGSVQPRRTFRQPANTKALKRAEKEAERQRQFELQKIAMQSDASQQESILNANMRAAETAFRADNEFRLQANAEQAAYQRARAAAKDDSERQRIDNQFRERMQYLEQRQRMELGQFEAGVQADRDNRLFGQQTQRDRTQQGYTQNNAMLQAGIQRDRDEFQVGAQRDRDGQLFDQSLQQGQIAFEQQGIRDERLQGFNQQNSRESFDQQMLRDERLQGFGQDNTRLNFDLNSQLNAQQNESSRESLIERALIASEQRRAEMTNQARVEGRQHSPEQLKKIEQIEQQKEEIRRRINSGEIRRTAGLRALNELETRASSYGAREQIQTPQQKLDGMMIEHPQYGAMIVGQDGVKQIQSMKTNPEMEQTKLEDQIRTAGLAYFRDLIKEGYDEQSAGKATEKSFKFNPMDGLQMERVASKEKEQKPVINELFVSDLAEKIQAQHTRDGEPPLDEDELARRIKSRLNVIRNSLNPDAAIPDAAIPDAAPGKAGMPLLWDENNTPPEGFTRSIQQNFATFDRSAVSREVLSDPQMKNMMDVASGYADTPDGPAVDAAVDTLLMLRSKSGELTPQEEELSNQAMLLLESLQ